MIVNVLAKFEKVYRADFFQGNDLKLTVGIEVGFFFLQDKYCTSTSACVSAPGDEFHSELY